MDGKKGKDDIKLPWMEGVEETHKKYIKELERIKALQGNKKIKEDYLDTLVSYQVDVFKLTIREVIDGVMELIDLARTEEELEELFKEAWNFIAWFTKILKNDINLKAEELKRKGKFFEARKKGGWVSLFYDE